MSMTDATIMWLCIGGGTILALGCGALAFAVWFNFQPPRDFT